MSKCGSSLLCVGFQKLSNPPTTWKTETRDFYEKRCGARGMRVATSLPPTVASRKAGVNGGRDHLRHQSSLLTELVA